MRNLERVYNTHPVLVDNAFSINFKYFNIRGGYDFPLWDLTQSILLMVDDESEEILLYTLKYPAKIRKERSIA